MYLDNVGYGDLGCYGNADVKTPRLDRLAREGVRCTDFYVSTSSCTPSRGALLTGRYPIRNGLEHQLRPEENRSGIGLPHREKIIPQYLKPAGYATGCFGKWNIGWAAGSRPTERGFDEFFGHASGNINYYTHTYHGRNDMFRGTEPVKVEGYSTDLFADAARDFIRRNANRPFLVYLPFNAAHFLGKQNMLPGEKPVWQVPGKCLEEYGLDPDEPDPRKRYRAVLTSLDDAIGRVLDTIDELGLRERTVIVVVSDNGAFMLKDRGLEVASNGPFRNGGITTYEGGVRIPCILRWPGRLPAGFVCREMLSHLDLLPFILASAGVDPPKDRVLDGRDPSTVFSGISPSPHLRLFFRYGGWNGMRRGSYKLVRPRRGKPDELYDLAKDPGERNDLGGKRPGILESMKRDLDDWLAQFRR